MKTGVYGLILAIQFLTRIPLTIECPWEQRTIKSALRSYGIAGFIIGMLLAALWWGTVLYFPIWFGGLAVISLWVYVSGGLHLDGLMDAADAKGSNKPLEGKWEIMKDPHVGSFGILALVFHLAWKTSFIFGLFVYGLDKNLLFSIFFIPALSRAAALIVLYQLPLMREKGLAFEWKKHMDRRDVIIGVGVVVCVGALSIWTIVLMAAYAVYYFILRWWIVRNFRGVNGDLIGLTIEGGRIMGAVRTLDLYVVRHGLTKANIEKRYIGHLDEPVMEERMEEMFELKKSLSTVAFDACFTSDRRRCLQTLHYLRPDLQGWKDVRLREISFGKWEGKRHEDLVQDPSYQRWLKDWQNTGPDGGERFPEFHDRVGVFLKEMVSSSYDQILLVTHGGVIRSLYQHLHPEASFWDISPPHGKGCYFRVSKSEEGWSCTSWSEVPVQENENTSENTSLL